MLMLHKKMIEHNKLLKSVAKCTPAQALYKRKAIGGYQTRYAIPIVSKRNFSRRRLLKTIFNSPCIPLKRYIKKYHRSQNISEQLYPNIHKIPTIHNKHLVYQIPTRLVHFQVSNRTSIALCPSYSNTSPQVVSSVYHNKIKEFLPPSIQGCICIMPK